MTVDTKRTIAALLASLMLLPTLAACSEDTPNTPDTADTTAPADTTTAETEPRETERHEIKDDLPADLKFNGRTFRVYVSTKAAHRDFVAGVEEKEGDIVNDVVMNRNMNVEERLEVKLVSDGFDWAWNTVAGAISQLILAGDYFTNVIGNIRTNYFNKTLYTDLCGDPDLLYQEVPDGKFTLDRMNTPRYGGRFRLSAFPEVR